jgi:hypothetical protein
VAGKIWSGVRQRCAGGIAAARKYLTRHPPADPDEVYLTEHHKYLKVAAAETYVRKAFFEFFARDPKFVLEAYFIHIPINLFHFGANANFTAKLRPAHVLFGPLADSIADQYFVLLIVLGSWIALALCVLGPSESEHNPLDPTRERDHQVPADGRGFPGDNLVNLTSGMAVTVEIKTGSRTVIRYLLSPLLRYKHESLRER